MWVSVFKWLEMDSLAHQATNRKPIARHMTRFSIPSLLNWLSLVSAYGVGQIVLGLTNVRLRKIIL